jgi:integrase
MARSASSSGGQSRRPGRRNVNGEGNIRQRRDGRREGRIGTPIEPRNLNRHLVGLLDRAGVRQIHFHDLRHPCATLLYEQRVPIEKIQDVLGHSSPTITKLICVDVTRAS